MQNVKPNLNGTTVALALDCVWSQWGWLSPGGYSILATYCTRRNQIVHVATVQTIPHMQPAEILEKFITD